MSDEWVITDVTESPVRCKWYHFLSKDEYWICHRCWDLNIKWQKSQGAVMGRDLRWYREEPGDEK